MNNALASHNRRSVCDRVFTDAGVAAYNSLVADTTGREDRIVTGNGVVVHGAAAADQRQVLRHCLVVQPRTIANAGVIPADRIAIQPGFIPVLRQVGLALHKAAEFANRHIDPNLPQGADAVQFRGDRVGDVGDLILFCRLGRLG